MTIDQRDSSRVGSALTATQKLQDLPLSILDALKASVEPIETVTLLAKDLLNLPEFAGVPTLGLRDVAEQLVDVVDVVPQLSHDTTALGLGHGGRLQSLLGTFANLRVRGRIGGLLELQDPAAPRSAPPGPLTGAVTWRRRRTVYRWPPRASRPGVGACAPRSPRRSPRGAMRLRR